ncbi:hypothetical protein Ccrd_009926 [Cynara cardunculus var. scolymus]|uniref:Uncharacterized protein n=1 Tax=Cynara cardunculus var. scolymus TaxID=59895 RepID=A0A103YM24_CYNCS|nr:hypothetical protein Ccrd_009926 [Cynara cardunculus var. scolymus]
MKKEHVGRDMESAKPSSSAPPYSGGAGGKFRKPPVSRRRPSTPYDRPSLTTGNNKSDESQDGGGGWLSKLVVNPARRLIIGGATRILPSFFSKSDSSSADEYEDDPSGDQDIQGIDATVGVSRWSGDAGPSNEMTKLKGSLEHNDARLDKSKNSIGDIGLDKIENMLKGKQFSRAESNRLMEILNSRLVDVSSAEEEKNTPDVISQGQAKEGVLDVEIPSTLTMGKQYDLERAVLETPMRRLQSNMREEVAASPIDIARAYMGSRTPELGFNTYSTILKDGREQQPSNLFSSKPHILTPSSKSSTCWPGAMVQDQRGFLTPQSQRGKYGLHNFPRTPYSRTVNSRTKPKLNQLQADSRSSNISLTTFQQSRTPNYRQMKSSGDVMDGGYGSVGPIRHVRKIFASEPGLEGPSSLFSAQVPSSSGASRSFIPVFQKNPETSGTSGTSNVNTVDTFKGEATPAGPSNETVRKILEQLDRHKPTPKEKAAELKLATEWKRSPSQDLTLMPKESTIVATLTEPDLQRSGVSSDNRTSLNGTNGGVSFKGMPDPTKTSNAATKTSSTVDVAGTGPSFGFKNMGGADQNSTVTNDKEKEKSQPWSVDNQMNGVDTARKRPSQPILKPISFKRPDPQQVISADNGRGFTFPFSVTSSSAAEPPTPSIMPSFPATQSKELPTYSFGTKKSNSERVVFSFPSTSNAAPIDDGESDLKFKFGSDKKKRVSFSSLGSDAIFIN